MSEIDPFEVEIIREFAGACKHIGGKIDRSNTVCRLTGDTKLTIDSYGDFHIDTGNNHLSVILVDEIEQGIDSDKEPYLIAKVSDYFPSGCSITKARSNKYIIHCNKVDTYDSEAPNYYDVERM